MIRKITIWLSLFLLLACQPNSTENKNNRQEAFLEDLKQRTFNFFWEQVDQPTWQIPDKYPTHQFTSIAATGFGMTAYLIGIENGFITRDEGSIRILNTFRWLWDSPQGPDSSGVSGYRGFFYHFLNYGTGDRYKKVELSTIDTGWLMTGILACQSYFNRNSPREKEIRALADSLFQRVEWDWAMNNNEYMSMGWHPEKGFINAQWQGYNEAMAVIILAMGSPTHAIHDTAWNSWCKTYQWGEFYGQEHINFHPLFGHQFSHMFIDFRGIFDPYMKNRGIDYFENSKRATLSNRSYCIDNPFNFKGYSDNIWGLTACDGPANSKHIINNDTIPFRTYMARGASKIRIIDDGTITPTAAGGSIPFAPDKCINALYAMKQQFGEKLYQEYGFKDAFNLTYTFGEGNEDGWFDVDYLGLDQGPIIIQLENYQTGLIWDLMKKNRYVVNGLMKAGFTGGWLDKFE